MEKSKFTSYSHRLINLGKDKGPLKLSYFKFKLTIRNTKFAYQHRRTKEKARGLKSTLQRRTILVFRFFKLENQGLAFSSNTSGNKRDLI